jgi:hypothetical protein
MRSGDSQAMLEAVRGLPPGAHMAAQVASLHLDPAQGNFEHGSVVLRQALVLANGSSEPPLDSTYVADLLRTGSGWRVADFTGQR